MYFNILFIIIKVFFSPFFFYLEGIIDKANLWYLLFIWLIFVIDCMNKVYNFNKDSVDLHHALSYQVVLFGFYGVFLMARNPYDVRSEMGLTNNPTK